MASVQKMAVERAGNWARPIPCTMLTLGSPTMTQGSDHIHQRQYDIVWGGYQQRSPSGSIAPRGQPLDIHDTPLFLTPHCGGYIIRWFNVQPPGFGRGCPLAVQVSSWKVEFRISIFEARIYDSSLEKDEW